jgi:hypothetical protein
MNTIKWLGIAVVALVVAAIGLSAYGASKWARATDNLLRQLESARLPQTVARYDIRQLAGLPPPVQRYFRAVLKDGQPMIAAVSVDHVGSFNMGETADQWKPFTSLQRVVTQRPGFVWNASISLFPGIPVRVHDAFVAGNGILHPAILGMSTLLPGDRFRQFLAYCPKNFITLARVARHWNLHRSARAAAAIRP